MTLQFDALSLLRLTLQFHINFLLNSAENSQLKKRRQQIFSPKNIKKRRFLWINSSKFVHIDNAVNKSKQISVEQFTDLQKNDVDNFSKFNSQKNP